VRCVRVPAWWRALSAPTLRARQVFVAGSFNKWTPSKLHRSGSGTFSTNINLPPGRYLYRFLVDGQTRHDPDMASEADEKGIISNVLVIPEAGNSSLSRMSGLSEGDSRGDAFVSDDEGERKPYGQEVPDEEEFTGDEPVLVPPHFTDVLLNASTRKADPYTLPVPNWSVTVNHLCVYQSSHRERRPQQSEVQVLGITLRHREKFVTTVYYKPVLPASET
jgi:5'-AMP-activated protein kinase regulatory beta subunit